VVTAAKPTGGGKKPPRPKELGLTDQIEEVRQRMFQAAENLEFETAARLRDELRQLQANQPPTSRHDPPASTTASASRANRSRRSGRGSTRRRR
jgi:excinuclease ABC subunit B